MNKKLILLVAALTKYDLVYGVDYNDECLNACIKLVEQENKSYDFLANLIYRLKEEGLSYDVHYNDETLEYAVEQVEQYGLNITQVANNIKCSWNNCCDEGEELQLNNGVPIF